LDKEKQKLFGQLIRDRRTALRIEVKELAKAIGVHPKTLYNIECGRNLIQLPAYFRLCHELQWAPAIAARIFVAK
jgi:transcriptional regulator with XRE-family HTH domain